MITVNSPSYNTAIGRIVYYHFKAEIKITGTNLNVLTDTNRRIALRAFPFHSACSSMTLAINGVSTAIPNPMAIVSVLMAQGLSSHSMALTASTCPCAPDQLADYADADGYTIPFGSPAGGPFSSYSSNPRTKGITGIKSASAIEVVLEVEFVCFFSPPHSHTIDGLTKGIVGMNSL